MLYIKKFITLLLLLSLNNMLISNTAEAINIPQEKTNYTTEDFLGKWSMQTVVTSSNCPYVLVGSTTESDLEIKPLSTNNDTASVLKALWKGGMWSQSIGEVKLLNEREAITERITEFKTNDNNNWKAVLIDHLKLDENNIMHSESIVIQYKNGLSVGEYKTYSILTKAD